jgi:Rieske Fe-S protein
MTQAQQPQKTLKPFIANIRAANPVGHLNLTLVPLGGEGHGRLDYILAADAIAAGQLTVSEVSAGGSVPELLVGSSSEKMILLLDGEELVGAKQNRILNTTVLLPAKAQMKIPVSCVEQGRWHSTSVLFQPGSYSPAKLRARKSRDVTRNLCADGVARSDQGAVWAEVEQNMVAMGAASPTMAMHDAIEHRQDSIGSYLDALKYPANASGVVVAINGRFSALDLFDKPETLERIWLRLLTGYAIDAIGQPTSGSKTFSAKATETLLEHVGEIPCSPCPTVGVGKDWRFEAPDIVGQALVANDICAHLGVFPNVAQSERAGTSAGILPPSRRGRKHGNDRAR